MQKLVGPFIVALLYRRYLWIDDRVVSAKTLRVVSSVAHVRGEKSAVETLRWTRPIIYEINLWRQILVNKLVL